MNANIFTTATDALLKTPEVTVGIMVISFLIWLIKAIGLVKAIVIEWRKRKRKRDCSQSRGRQRILQRVRALIKHINDLDVKKLAAPAGAIAAPTIAATLSLVVFNLSSSPPLQLSSPPQFLPLPREPDIVPQPQPPLWPDIVTLARIEEQMRTNVVTLARIEEQVRTNVVTVTTLKEVLAKEVFDAVSPELDKLISELEQVMAAVYLIINLMPYVDPTGLLYPGILPRLEGLRRLYPHLF